MSTSKALTLPKIGLPSTSLDAYITRIRQIPLLTVQAEKKLAEAFYYQKDLSAAQQLVISNLRFVVYIAQGYAGYGLVMSDLIQEGSIGLMKAVKRFDPRMGVRLISFAVHWIKSEIQEFILKNWRLVKIATTKAKRKLFFNLRKIKKQIGWATQQEVDTIAQHLQVDSKLVREMEGHLNFQDMSLESKLDETNDSQADTHTKNQLPVAAFADSRYDPAYLLEASDFSEQGSYALQKALTNLDARSQDIIKQRWLGAPKATLEKLATYYKVSIERIRQIEKKALKQLRSQLAAYS